MTGPSHRHVGTANGRHRRRLVLVVIITGATVVAQVVGGLLSGSLALLADPGHTLTDSTGLILALVAATLAVRPATSTRTFGLPLVEVLAALTNGLLLVGVARRPQPMPTADRRIGRMQLWKPSTIQRWHAQRPRTGTDP